MKTFDTYLLELRNLVVALLDDDCGISDAAWKILREELEDCDDEYKDILNSVKVQDGRWYLSEGWNEKNGGVASNFRIGE